MVIVRVYSVLSTRLNTCPPYFKVESKIARDFAPQCSMFTYIQVRIIVNKWLWTWLEILLIRH